MVVTLVLKLVDDMETSSAKDPPAASTSALV
jgi:hypothetical protein